jgi:histidinol phosphatase-like PHP family hydrolase
LYDFHTHTFLSDGALAPIELVRRAQVIGYRGMAITDHVGPGNLEYVVRTLTVDCRAATSRWDILVLPGVEITHAPKEDIDMLAAEAKKMGARVVNVHGETIVEPVEPGTNMAAVSSGHVDILAHPGLVTHEVASIAAANGVFLEVSGRRGHSYANGHVVRVAREAGARMVLDSDAHQPGDLLTDEFALEVAMGAGLSRAEAEALLSDGPRQVLERVGAAEEA